MHTFFSGSHVIIHTTDDAIDKVCSLQVSSDRHQRLFFRKRV